MRRIKEKIEGSITNADYAISAGSATKATSADSATKATSADKLSTSAGTTTQPVYFKDGKPIVIGYTIAKSVPADAKFTDTNTTYDNMCGASASSAGKSGLVPAPAAGTANRYLRSDGTWQVPPDTNTWRGIQNSLTSNSTTDSLSAAQGKELKTLVDEKADKNHSHPYLSLSGGTMTGFISFTEDTKGLWWKVKNGDVYEMRPYYPGSLFQLVRTPSGGASYGAFDIHSDGGIDLNAVGQTLKIIAGNVDHTFHADGLHTDLKGNADTATIAASIYDEDRAHSIWFDLNNTRISPDDDYWIVAHTNDYGDGFELRDIRIGDFRRTMVPASGGDVTGYLNFAETNTGLSWTCANGDIYHFRAYSPNSVFQLTRQNPSGVGEYGVLNVYGDGSINVTARGGLSLTLGDDTRSFLDWTYPVGSIYLSVNSTSPAAKFGGTWTPIENLFLYPVPTSTAAGVQGGESSHTLTVAEMPSHTHKTYMAYGANGDGPNIPIYERSTNKCEGYAILPDTSAVGGNTAHNNMPPYMTMYAWYRVG